MQSKTKTYATTANIGTNNSSLLCSLPHCSHDSRPLSGKENEILKTLCETKSKSAYAGIIRQRCQEIIESGDAVLFREFIDTLISQLNDCEATMEKILSAEGIKILKVLSHNSSLF
jgi:hypothetical protein